MSKQSEHVYGIADFPNNATALGFLLKEIIFSLLGNVSLALPVFGVAKIMVHHGKSLSPGWPKSLKSIINPYVFLMILQDKRCITVHHGASRFLKSLENHYKNKRFFVFCCILGICAVARVFKTSL